MFKTIEGAADCEIRYVTHLHLMQRFRFSAVTPLRHIHAFMVWEGNFSLFVLFQARAGNVFYQSSAIRLP